MVRSAEDIFVYRMGGEKVNGTLVFMLACDPRLSWVSELLNVDGGVVAKGKRTPK